MAAEARAVAPAAQYNLAGSDNGSEGHGPRLPARRGLTRRYIVPVGPGLRHRTSIEPQEHIELLFLRISVEMPPDVAEQ